MITQRCNATDALCCRTFCAFAFALCALGGVRTWRHSRLLVLSAENVAPRALPLLRPRPVAARLRAF